jgi:hypothetical protein
MFTYGSYFRKEGRKEFVPLKSFSGGAADAAIRSVSNFKGDCYAARR